jgi:hypothetical protein
VRTRFIAAQICRLPLAKKQVGDWLKAWDLGALGFGITEELFHRREEGDGRRRRWPEVEGVVMV